MKSLTLTQIREIQRTINLITSAYIEGHISKEVADEACNMLQKRLQDDDAIKHACYYYVLDISELSQFEQEYHVTNGTICCVLSVGKLYLYFNSEWMELA